MPIFRYVCKECERGFEKIVQQSTAVECPSCQSQAVEKQLSVFNLGGGGSRSFDRLPAAGPCGSCGDPRGPGSCSID